MLLVATACTLIAATGCGSDATSEPQAEPRARPAVAAHTVHGDRLFGFPAISEPAVRTDPGELRADLPGLYTDPQKAVADSRSEGFIAGVSRTFKSKDGPGAAFHVVVQMRGAEGAAAEFERQVDSLLHQPCAPGLECRRESERFAVLGMPGAAGVNTALTIENQPGGLHPEVLRADAIVFRDDAFVEQIFLSTRRPSKHRAALIKAARVLRQQGT